MNVVDDCTSGKMKRDTEPIVCYTLKEGHEVLKKLSVVMKQVLGTK
jgi:hypothetical protein